jgi:hypothetical protein
MVLPCGSCAHEHTSAAHKRSNISDGMPCIHTPCTHTAHAVCAHARVTTRPASGSSSNTAKAPQPTRQRRDALSEQPSPRVDARVRRRKVKALAACLRAVRAIGPHIFTALREGARDTRAAARLPAARTRSARPRRAARRERVSCAAHRAARADAGRRRHALARHGARHGAAGREGGRLQHAAGAKFKNGGNCPRTMYGSLHCCYCSSQPRVHQPHSSARAPGGQTAWCRRSVLF